MDNRAIDQLGVVCIGRNEGERLRKCLESVVGSANHVVYVDSGSTDGSIELAQSLGVEVVSLDLTKPFTAARARNEGFQALQQRRPDIRYVQFVDGDCEVVAGWLDAAVAFLANHPEYAVVCGRRRERHPERSTYNRLCDIEWNTPIGDARSCGGDAMVLVSAFEEVNGYRPGLIAGEEPELCVRLRLAGWRIFRMNHEMTLHDAAMTRFRQWWKRSMRAGFAFAEGASLHGRGREKHWVRETWRAVAWGLALPLFLMVMAVVGHPLWLLGAALYPIQIMRLAQAPHVPDSGEMTHSLFLVLGKFPEAVGALKFWASRLMGSPSQLIEYK